MCTFFRLGAVIALSTLVSLATDSQFAAAQRFNFGGQNNSNRDDEDRDRDEDEDRDEGENDNQGRRGSRSSKSSTEEQIQQFLQRRQTGQNNQNQGQQGGTQQLRRGNRQGQGEQLQDGQFQKGQLQIQGGRIQGSQFQQFRPQDGQQGLRFGNWQGNQWQGSRDVENWAKVFGSGKQPFSREWYEEHPKAWRHDEHDHDDVWITATLPGVYTWLGWGDSPGIRIGTQPRADLSRFHHFYPLGVYSLMSGPGDMGTRIVQLSIDRHGHISGNYYDMITDTNSSVSGDVRRDSQRVYWYVNKNRSIRFRASLNRLLQPYGTVVVQMPGGEQDWQFVRLER